jgi:Zn finger protein HypA/HybF involved in hydrogenase expression
MAEAKPPTETCPLTTADGSGFVTGEYWRWCPRCSTELINQQCKLRCPNCHYFMSCSDFD